MTLPRLKLKNIEKFAIDNSPTILTTIGVLGVVGTAVLTHKAATKAALIVREEEDKLWSTHPLPHTEVEGKERVKLTWKLYISPVAAGGVTVGCIIMANRIGSKRAAAVAAAYAISEKAYSEYREKVVEKIGEAKERNIRDEVAHDQIARNPQSESNVVIVGNGNVLCCDLFSMRYFDSSVEDLKKAQNDTNYQVLNDSYASLSDFYDRVGLPRTDVSDEIGWNCDKLMELEFTTVLSEDGRPCVAFRFQAHPIRGYHSLHP